MAAEAKEKELIRRQEEEEEEEEDMRRAALERDSSRRRTSKQMAPMARTYRVCRRLFFAPLYYIHQSEFLFSLFYRSEVIPLGRPP